ncbi:hypothetical protein [Actinokineospora globicatena]|uniref:Uncharacterized protein n=1 Tax=Actinokineospora globicatena TaxID=103729 RepID=A0A9W6QN67_9PSEU|nr:hypothetical protein [Actinokineospora globicatena]GLW91705.1 hypothetical protein Aglo03_25210 [Actinokineospora globicatena]
MVDERASRQAAKLLVVMAVFGSVAIVLLLTIGGRVLALILAIPFVELLIAAVVVARRVFR